MATINGIKDEDRWVLPAPGSGKIGIVKAYLTDYIARNEVPWAKPGDDPVYLPGNETMAAMSKKWFGIRVSTGTVHLAEKKLVEEGWLIPGGRGYPYRMNLEKVLAVEPVPGTTKSNPLQGGIQSALSPVNTIAPSVTAKELVEALDEVTNAFSDLADLLRRLT